jgi:predicted HTH transcriptional regulator
MLVDLKTLYSRESERVEWKENVADIDNIIKTIRAFANDFLNLGGGYIVCGAREGKDEHGFQKTLAHVGFRGLISQYKPSPPEVIQLYCRAHLSSYNKRLFINSMGYD